MNNPTQAPAVIAPAPTDLPLVPTSSDVVLPPATPTPSIVVRTLAWVTTVSLLFGYGLVAAQTFASIAFLYNGYKGQSQILMGFLPILGVAFIAVLLTFVVVWVVSRLLYRSESYALWASLTLGIYACVWFFELYVALPFAFTTFIHPTDDGLGEALLVGIFALFIKVFSILGLLLSLIFSLAFWRSKRRVIRSGCLAALLLAIIGAALLIYSSGALKYPAIALKENILCYGILSKTERMSCLVSSFVATEVASPDVPAAAESADFDSVKVNINYPHDFKFIGGKFVFAGAFTNASGVHVDKVFIDGEAVPAAGSVLASGPSDVGSGRIAYVSKSFSFASDKNQPPMTLVVGGKNVLTAEHIALLDTPGTLTYVVYDSHGSYAVVEGNKVAEGDDATRAFADTAWKEHLARLQDSSGVTAMRDDAARRITYRTGSHVLIMDTDGLTMDSKLIAPGLATWGVSSVNGKLIFAAYGLGADRKLVTYIFAEHGVMSDALRTLIASYPPIGN